MWFIIKSISFTRNVFIKTWNINDYQGNKNVFKCTNNGLESYNKCLKGLFRAGTPSFVDCVHTMGGESEHQQKKALGYMDKLAVKKGKSNENDGDFIYEMPPCYAGWVPPSSIGNWKNWINKNIDV